MKSNNKTKRKILGIVLPFMACIFLTCLNAYSQENVLDDPYLWLEDIEGEKQLEWVEDHNTKTFEYLTNTENYQDRYDFRYKTLISQEKIAWPKIRDDYVYNYWQDDTFPRGVWRRKHFEEYLADEGDWEIVLDIGLLSEEEDMNWVYKGVIFGPEGMERCILLLSKGGSDATYIREFDLEEKKFIETGYKVDEAKSTFDWIDIDNAYIASDFGEGSLTSSGYPRIVKRWERGSTLDEAEIIFEADESDLGAFPIVWHLKEKRYEFIYHALDFYRSRLYLVHNGNLIPVPLPDNFTFEVSSEKLIVQPLVEWEYGDSIISTNQVVSIDLKDIMHGDYTYQVVFQTSDRISVEDLIMAGDDLLLNTLNNISSELLKFSFQDGNWHQELVDLPDKGAISIISTSGYKPYYFVSFESFIQPTTLYCAMGDDKSPLSLKSYPIYFDASDLVVNQYETKSKDGVMIPYFIVHKKDLKFDGNNPLIQYGYGGFQVSEKPYYSPTLGKLWLEKGGVYVLTNIRGGGEFGPEWHTAAILGNKQKSYDDFIAITEDLIARNISSPERIGITGGSNGGLLVGAVMVQRPDLYGAVTSFVPLLDMKRYSKLLAGHSWMAEYGDPDIPEQWEYISKYSPYQNVEKDVTYPISFFLTSTRDDRVHPGHARKMTAKMESLGSEVYLFENTEGGHSTTVTPEQKSRLTALYYTFFCDQLMNNNPGK